jgi:creatinine amidohydrolase/Fe(II)-dependent formamide hydrolase-like protein
MAALPKEDRAKIPDAGRAADRDVGDHGRPTLAMAANGGRIVTRAVEGAVRLLGVVAEQQQRCQRRPDR